MKISSSDHQRIGGENSCYIRKWNRDGNCTQEVYGQKYIVVDTICIVKNVNAKVLFDPSEINSFISPYVVDTCGLESYKNDDFILVEMASGLNQAVGPSVNDCWVKIGVSTNKFNLYVTNMGTCEIIISMDWL